MIHRECGVLKTTYEADMGLYPLPIARWTVAAVAVVFFLIIPLTLHEYFLSVANLVFVAIIGALGLNILVGYTGQVSIGHGAFMSVGAYTAANLAIRLDSPWPVNLLAGGLMAAAVGAVIALPVFSAGSTASVSGLVSSTGCTFRAAAASGLSSPVPLASCMRCRRVITMRGLFTNTRNKLNSYVVSTSAPESSLNRDLDTTR